MMNINEQWRNADEQKDNDLEALLELPVISKLPSKDPLKKIKQNLIINSIFGIVIGSIYIIILVKFPLWQLFVCLGIVLGFTVWAVVKAIQLYQQLELKHPGYSVLEKMEEHYSNLTKFLKLQQNVGLIIYPISAAGGFMLGGYVGSGKPIEQFMSKPVVLIALVISIIVLVPLCHYFAKWMNKKAFGQFADVLKQNIETLKNEE